MRTDRIFLALALSLAMGGSAWAQALGPGGPTAQQKTTAVNSQTQSQLNTTSHTLLPTINMIIQQTFQGTPQRGTRADGGDQFDPGHRGMAAAADGETPMQVWVNVGGGNSKNSLAASGYSLDNYGGQGGVQLELTPTLVLGLSGSWQNTNGSLNGGFTSENTTLGVTPYVGWQFDEHWNLSGTAGYSQGHTKLGNAALGYGANYQNNQWDYQGGLNGSYFVGPLRLAPVVSLLYSQQNTHSAIDSTGATVPGSNTALMRGSAGGSVSYPLTGWEPYIRAGAEHDFIVPNGSGPNGSDGGTVGGGVTVTFSPAIWASIDAGYNSIGRTGLSLWSASARINLRF